MSDAYSRSVTLSHHELFVCPLVQGKYKCCDVRMLTILDSPELGNRPIIIRRPICTLKRIIEWPLVNFETRPHCPLY